MGIPSAVITGLAPHVIEALGLAIKTMNIIQNPNATVEDVRQLRNECLASEKRLEALIAQALVDEDNGA